MNIIVFYIIGRFFKAQSWNMLTFGIFGINETTEKASKQADIYSNPAVIAIAWNFIVNMMLIILYANIDVSFSSIISIDQLKSGKYQCDLLLGFRLVARRLPNKEAIFFWKAYDLGDGGS